MTRTHDGQNVSLSAARSLGTCGQELVLHRFIIFECFICFASDGTGSDLRKLVVIPFPKEEPRDVLSCNVIERYVH